jgi:hypothetical protein
VVLRSLTSTGYAVQLNSIALRIADSVATQLVQCTAAVSTLGQQSTTRLRSDNFPTMHV